MSRATAPASATSLDAEIAFGEVFRRWSEPAAGRVGWPDWVGPTARRRLEQHLVSTISRVGSTSIYPLFDTRRERGYDEFVRWCGPAEIRAAAPVLVDLADLLADQWVEMVGELVTWLAADRRQVWGDDVAIADLRCGLGDRHRGGRQVHLVEPAEGPPFVLKPRSLAPEEAFYGLGVDSGLFDPRARPRIVDRGSHGWMSFVAATPVTDPVGFWRRAGALLRLVQVTGTADLHQSNVIAGEWGVVPVDLECLAVPDLISAASDEIVLDDGIIRDSVMRTGLLPHSMSQAGAIAVEWSGLFGAGGQLNGNWRTTFERAGTDAMRRVRRPLRTPRSPNRPCTPQGALIEADVAALVAGYEEAYDALDEPMVVAALGGVAGRVLVRATAAYAARIEAATRPEALGDHDAFRDALHALPPFGDALSAVLGEAGIEAVVKSETAALDRLDIPLLTAAGADIGLDDGAVLAGRLTRDGVSRVGERIRRSSPELRRIESGVIRILAEPAVGVAAEATEPATGVAAEATEPAVGVAAEATEPATGHQGGSPPLWRQHGIAIAEGVAADAIERRDGKLVWLEAYPAGSGGSLRPVVGGPDLYSGSAGIAVMLAAAAGAAGSASLADAARRALPRGGVGEAPMWLQSGWSGRLWARAVVGSLLDDEELVADAASELVAALPDELDPGASADYIGGYAGALAAASGIARLHGGDAAVGGVESFAVRVGEVLDEQAAEPSRAAQLERLSVAHGSFGISHAFGAVADLTGSTEVRARFVALVEREQERIAARDGIAGRIDHVDRQRIASLTWCWGVTGYLLTRMRPWFDDLRAEMAPTIGHSLDLLAGSTTSLAHACCGAAGQLEAASIVAQSGDRRAMAVTERLAGHLAHTAPLRFHRTTSYQGPSLFRGRAGLALAYLRAADPTLPSALDAG